MSETYDAYVKPYQYNAFADYVIQHHPSYEQWINNQFINIVGMSGKDIHSSVDYFCGNIFGKLPLLMIEDKSKIIANNGTLLKETIINGFEKKKNIFLFLDHFYISEFAEYQKRHITHDILLLDRKDNKINCLENVNGFLKITHVDFDALIKSFSSDDNECVYELYPSSNQYSFELDRFICMVDDYKTGKVIRNKNIYLSDKGFYSNQFFDERAKLISHYGINVYDLIATKAEESIKQGQEIDYRMFYIIFEKNMNMRKKLSYIQKHYFNNHAYSDYFLMSLDNICSQLKKLMYRVLQYDMSNDCKFVANIRDDLMVLQDRERAFYGELLNILS